MIRVIANTGINIKNMIACNTQHKIIVATWRVLSNIYKHTYKPN
jgi:hypothetical protein